MIDIFNPRFTSNRFTITERKTISKNTRTQNHGSAMSFHSTPLKISSPLSNAKRASCIASSYHLETQEKGKSIALCFERTRVGLARKSYIRSSNIFNHCTMSENGPERTRPFVLLTGTPGTGKTTTASLIAVRKHSRKESFGIEASPMI